MESRSSLRNTLKEEIETKRWNMRPSTLQNISASDLTDFPIMTESELLKFTSGPYQIRMSLSYLGEIRGPNDEIPIKCVRLEPTIVRVDVRSRHSESVVYRVYVDYDPDKNSVDGIKRYYECKNGARTEGCCAHVATIVYYLSYGRWLPTIPRPAAFLTNLSVPEDSDSDAVIEEETAGPSHAV